MASALVAALTSAAIEGLAAGEKSIISSAVVNLQQKVIEYLSYQYESHFCIKMKLKELQKYLPLIQATISAAEKKEINNTQLTKWLDDLKDAVYDAEDVLDVFEYRMIEEEIEGRTSNQGESEVRKVCQCFDFLSVLLQKLRNPDRFFGRASITVKRIVLHDEDFNELKAVISTFKCLFDEMHRHLPLVQLEHNAAASSAQVEVSSHRTTANSRELKVFGRDGEISYLVQKVLDGQAYPNSQKYSVLSIVGLGGMGKSTLAQSIYNHEDVKNHFHVMAWVWVGKKFNIENVIIELIESAYKDNPDAMPANLHSLRSLDSLQFYLGKCLEGKRFFVVLDYVWHDKDLRNKWETLSIPFNSGEAGSTVIVTTREEEVARLMGSKQTTNLKGLRKEDYWDFFKQCAFCDVGPEYQDARLEDIGKQIADKLGGSPLAAKETGSLLKSKVEERYWRYILETKSSKIDQVKYEVTAALKSSYNHLPSNLKQCFGYCLLFPKKYRYEKDRLIRMWIALGYVQSTAMEGRIEDIGERYFDELVSRCLFQKENDDHVEIPDSLHDLASLIYGDEVCQVEDESAEVPNRVRHLLVTCGNLDMVLEHVNRIEKLRSLVFLPQEHFSFTLTEDTFMRLKGLRILVLPEHPNINEALPLPKATGFMVHLRYLEYDTNYNTPESLYKLYNLQTIEFHETYDPNPMPKVLSKLINLRWIGADEESISKLSCIGQLKLLQKLKSYKVTKEKGHKILELRDLRHIRGSLQIAGLENVINKAEATEAELGNKVHLSKLALKWTSYEFALALEHEEVLEGLRPHNNLRELSIDRFSGGRCPSWLDKAWSSNLERIELRFCYVLEALPALGQLAFLKSLSLFILPRLKQIGAEFYGKGGTAFPSLEELRLEDAAELTEWSSAEEGQQCLPRLRRVKVAECPKLMGRTAGFLSSPRSLVEELDIDDMSLLAKGLPRDFLGRLQMLELQKIEAIDKELQECFQHLRSLKELTFFDCQRLPTLEHLSSLEKLVIYWCKISLLPELPTSLKELVINRCGKIQTLPKLPAGMGTLSVHSCDVMESLSELPTGMIELHIFQCPTLEDRYDWRKGGPDWHKISHIRRIRFDYKILHHPPTALLVVD